jgi:DNA-binding MarR family transcriptional regulator
MKKVGDIDLSGAFGCAAFTLRKTARVVSQAYDNAMRRGGLRSTQFTVLVAVYRRQPISVGALAELTLMSPTTMTRNLALLRKDGLVEIAERGPRREKLVRITEKGREALARTAPLWRAAQQRFEARYGKKSWNDLRHALDRVVDPKDA